MKEHYAKIYAEHAEAYDRLVSREDYQGNLLPAIGKVARLQGAEVVELGMGTGRLTIQLAPIVKSICGFDRETSMLSVARRRLGGLDVANWAVAIADHRQLPSPSSSADLALEGWAFGHLVEDGPEPWTGPVDSSLGEMERVVRPGGTMLLIETLGTGCETPAPPTDRLAAFYAYLEAKGFVRNWVRTDYQFASRREAEELAGPFFGGAVLGRMAGDLVLPECTGLWSKSVPVR